MASLLILWHSVSIDRAAPHGIALLPASIVRIALHGVDRAILAFLHDSHMVDRAVISPIKENNVACLRLIVFILPLPPAFEPVYTVRAEGEFRDNATFQIAALFTAPRNKICLKPHQSAM